MGDNDNVKVAVRVRPFNEREKSRGAKLIIKMNGNQTTIFNPDDSSKSGKNFNFDYSYWSHDGFATRPDGYLEPKNSIYADQKIVFNDLGKGVLDNAWKGYNSSLFAYGQTGSGKSYSMVGFGANKGIVPVVCEELFKEIRSKKDSLQTNEELNVTVSMLEIYNEQIRDLLQSKVKRGGLKVREHPTKGFYVESLTVAAVYSYKEVESKINEGTTNRTIAATNMNATSSRAHTIVAINFTQKMNDATGKNMTRTSVINLVDLAGSERVASTGATGDRLKEGSAINLSLSTLGNCISCLADMGDGQKNVRVPYRDSTLTKLLKNALGGNSRTVMIAALSPADINFDETLSTLRYADRAKAIKTKAVVNESPTDKLIRELREENARLLEMLKQGKIPDMEKTDEDGSSSEEIEEMRKTMEETVRRNQDEMEEMKRTWEERLIAAQEEAKTKIEDVESREKRRQNTPHLWNLNEDAALSGMVVYFCEEGKTRVGNNKEESEICLRGTKILPQHAVIENSKGKVNLKICSKAAVMINGQAVSKDVVLLHHNDRVLFGSSQLYVFHNPVDYAQMLKKGSPVAEPTFESAQEEIAEKQGALKMVGSDKDDMILQDDLIRILPMVKEANAMAEELGKKVSFEVILVSPLARGQTHGRPEVCVKMQSTETGNEWTWGGPKFTNRKFIMQEMYAAYIDEDANWDLPPEKDPFWEDPNTEILIGCAQVYLQPLAHLIEVDDNIPIMDYRGTNQGQLAVELWPCRPDWTPCREEEFLDEPDDLVGKKMNLKIKVHNARGLSERFSKVFCRYKFYLDNDYTTTPEIAKSINPDFNFEGKFTVTGVTSQMVAYFRDQSLAIEVWGRQREAVLKKAKKGDAAAKKPTPPPPVTAHAVNNNESKSNEALNAEIQSLNEQLTRERKRGADLADRNMAELEKEKKIGRSANEKLMHIQNIVGYAKKNGQSSVEVAAIEDILNRDGGTANPFVNKTSSTCQLQ